MAITVLNVMERVGSSQTAKVAGYINNALNEIADVIADRILRTTIDIQSDIRFYDLPPEMKDLRGVFARDFTTSDKNIWRRIPRIVRFDYIDEGGVDDSVTVVDGNLIT